MEELRALENYEEYKQELDQELQKSAEGFVRIGYLLKLARDTDILKGSGYKNHVEFAQAEYNIDKTMVSRFININDRFSENGNSEYLQERYRGYGYAKLAIMLQIPDEVNSIITPDFSKSEIQTLKQEVDEEKKISDIEVLIEQEPAVMKEAQSLLEKAIRKLLHDEPQKYVELYERIGNAEKAEEYIKTISQVLAPSETKVETVRIPGIGRLMISFRGTDRDIEVVNIRTGESETFSWGTMVGTVLSMMSEAEDAKASWQQLYEEPFPEEKKVEVAPVQQKKPEPKKQSKVTKAKVEQPKTPKYKESVNEEPENKEPVAEVEEDTKEIEKAIEVEVMPGIKAQITDMEKATSAAKMEERKAIIEAAPHHTTEEPEEQLEGQMDIESDMPQICPPKMRMEYMKTLNVNQMANYLCRKLNRGTLQFADEMIDWLKTLVDENGKEVKQND